jgi:hypothetical protein
MMMSKEYVLIMLKILFLMMVAILEEESSELNYEGLSNV